MFGFQGITSDSRMNNVLADSDRQLVPSAAFMHFARIDVTDHIQARLRHFRAAKAENDLDRFTKKSRMYEPAIADEIAKKITQKYPQATRAASDFLLQCALRHQVSEICNTIASGKKYEPKTPDTTIDKIDINTNVNSFKEASERIVVYLSTVDWDSLNSGVTSGKGTTQNNQPRIPIDLEPFLKSNPHRQIIFDHLGIDEGVAI